MITYRTLAVFDPALEQPFNDWTPRHVAQGFTWREGSVSFATLDDGGMAQVSVRLVDEIHLNAMAQRAIIVPFGVGTGGLVEVTSIDQGPQISIASGNYALVYETGRNTDTTMWCSLTFVPSVEPVDPHIPVADEALSPAYPLLMEAVPAGP
jgi:hypothetical protein